MANIVMPSVTDDTSVPPGQNGTILDLAKWTALGAAVDTAVNTQGLPVVQTTTLTGTQTPALTTGCRHFRCNNPTLLTLGGFLSTGVVAGQILSIESIGAGQVDLPHRSVGTDTQMDNIATSGITSLAAGSGRALYVYVSPYWRLIGHDQGAWITPTFAAGDFTGNGSMTWTVTSGQRILGRYLLRGRTLNYAFSFDNTTVGGTPNTLLQIGNGAWGGFTAASTGFYDALAYANDNGTVLAAMIQCASGTSLSIQKTTNANWTAGGNYARGKFDFEVT